MTILPRAENLQQALAHAGALAAKAGATRIGTEHLLLAITRNEDDPAMMLLSVGPISRRHMRAMVPRNRDVVGKVRTPRDAAPLDLMTTSAERAMALSQEIAREADHTFVDTPHLLIALSRIPQSTAGRVIGETSFQHLDPIRTLARVYQPGTPTPEPRLQAWGRKYAQVRLTGRMTDLSNRVSLTAATRGHERSGVEHLLYELTRESGGHMSWILDQLRIEVAVLKADTEAGVGPQVRDPQGDSDYFLQPDEALSRVMHLSIEEAAGAHAETISTADALSALLRSPGAVAPLLAKHPKLTVDAVRAQRARLVE